MSRVWADDLFDAWVEVEDVGGGLQRFVLVWCQVDREHAARRVEGDDQALFRAADRGERCSLGDSSRLVGAEGEPYFGHRSWVASRLCRVPDGRSTRQLGGLPREWCSPAGALGETAATLRRRSSLVKARARAQPPRSAGGVPGAHHPCESGGSGPRRSASRQQVAAPRPPPGGPRAGIPPEP